MRREWWRQGNVTSHSFLIGFCTCLSYLPGNFMTSNIFLITFLTFTGFLAVALEGRKDELEVVQSVDLTRYVGRWYEIARLPNSFQKKCADMVTADYTMRADGKIEVINRCRKASGEYATRSEEHTSELQSQSNLVCRLLLEKKK